MNVQATPMRRAASRASPQWELHIQELVVYGDARTVDRRLLAEVVQRELARLLADASLPPAAGSEPHTIHRLDGGSIGLAPDAAADALGAEVAAAVYRAVTGAVPLAQAPAAAPQPRRLPAAAARGQARAAGEGTPR
jgi:hypothetical protein